MDSQKFSSQCERLDTQIEDDPPKLGSEIDTLDVRKSIKKPFSRVVQKGDELYFGNLKIKADSTKFDKELSLSPGFPKKQFHILTGSPIQNFVQLNFNENDFSRSIDYKRGVTKTWTPNNIKRKNETPTLFGATQQYIQKEDFGIVQLGNRSARTTKNEKDQKTNKNLERLRSRAAELAELEKKKLRDIEEAKI